MSILEQFSKLVTNNNEKLLAARNATQFELAKRKGVDFGAWMDMKYHDRFREIIEANPKILEKLADENTHAAAVEEIEHELYPTSTIH